MQQVLKLIGKDMLLELRQKQIIMGLVLYSCATTFIIFIMNGEPDGVLWNVLFWVVQLFTVINVVAKSFLQESPERLRYYFQICSPQHFIMAKLIYNILLQSLITFISLLLFFVLLGNPIEQTGKFLLVAFLGTTGLSTTFTFLSAVAGSVQQNAAVVAILGFPLVLPMLLIIQRLAAATITSVVLENWIGLVAVLFALIVLVGVLSYILFPILWKE